MSNVWKRVVPEDEPAPDTATVDQIMALVNDYAHGDHETAQPASVRWASIRAAVERVIAENLQRGNVIGRIAAHLLGRQNNVSDEDVVIAAAEVGRELQGARERAERAGAENARLRNVISKTAAEIGCGVSPKCSVEFMEILPAEAGAAMMRWRKIEAERDALKALLAAVRDDWMRSPDPGGTYWVARIDAALTPSKSPAPPPAD